MRRHSDLRPALLAVALMAYPWSSSAVEAVPPVVPTASAVALTAMQGRQWNFRVYLDDTPIGRHRFTLRREGERGELLSEAQFQVKLLFITAYRYAHRAIERWRGDCLTAMTASTDDDGERLDVEARAVAAEQGARLEVSGAAGRRPLHGCVMSYAYWNPRILQQQRLLNAQTGAYEAVRITDLGEERIDVAGAPVEARRYRIAGSKHPIDVWYSEQQEWLALESTVDGGRRLRYRMEGTGQ